MTTRREARSHDEGAQGSGHDDGILGPDAILHLFWAATGSSWPASSTSALSRGLLNVEVPFEPRNLVVIASMPAAASVLVLARAGMLGRLGRRLPAWLPRLGTLALSGGASLRLLAGIVWIAGVGADPSSTFYRLNLTVYTPLCAALTIASVIVLRAPGRPAAAATPDVPPYDDAAMSAISGR